MNVGSLAADGVDDEGVDVTDDRRVVFLGFPTLRELDGQAVFRGFTEDFLVGNADLTATVAAGNGDPEFVRRREFRIKRKLEDTGQGIEAFGIERVSDSDEELHPIHLQRQDMGTLRLVAANKLQ